MCESTVLLWTPPLYIQVLLRKCVCSQNVNFQIDGPFKLIKLAAKINVYEEPSLGEPCFARRKLISFRFANGAIRELMVTEWTVFVN